MATENASILAATDLSARSDRAVDRAAFLAAEWGVQLFLAHVIERGDRLDGDAHLAEAAVRAVLPQPDADANILVLQGSTPKAIVEAARDAGCGLIATGVARFNRAGDFMTGTTVGHIVRHSSVPVLVVKQRPRAAYRTIVVATDFSRCSRAALLCVVRMFPQALIHVVHACHIPYETLLDSDDMRRYGAEEAQRELDAFVADPEIPADLRGGIHAHHGVGVTTKVVGDFVTAFSADLVVLGTHGKSGFAQAIIGSTAEAILFWVQADTLMVRELP